MALALALSVLALGAVGQFGVVVENLAIGRRRDRFGRTRGRDLGQAGGIMWGSVGDRFWIVLR